MPQLETHHDLISLIATDTGHNSKPVYMISRIKSLPKFESLSFAWWSWNGGALEISNARVVKRSLCYSDRTLSSQIIKSYSAMNLTIESPLLSSTIEKRWHKTGVSLVRFNAPLHLQPKLREWMTDVNSVYEWIGILIRKKLELDWLRNGFLELLKICRRILLFFS